MEGSADETTVWSIEPMNTGSSAPATIHKVCRCVNFGATLLSGLLGAFIPGCIPLVLRATV